VFFFFWQVVSTEKKENFHLCEFVYLFVRARAKQGSKNYYVPCKMWYVIYFFWICSLSHLEKRILSEHFFFLGGPGKRKARTYNFFLSHNEYHKV